MNAPFHIDHLRIPPHSIDAEQAVLGALMLDAASLVKISDWLTEDDFFRKDHRLIFRAIVELDGRNLPCDPVTLADWFSTNKLADQVGGAGYVIKLANSTPSAANIIAYAEIVREKSRLRALIDTGTRVAANAFDPKANSANIATVAAAEIAVLGAEARGGLVPVSTGVKSWFQRLHERFERNEEFTGVLTPFANVNEFTLGLQPSDLIIVAGRSSMGKSILGFQLAAFNALAGARTSLSSIEMRADQVVQRTVSAFGRIPHRSLQRPRDLNDDQWTTISQTMSRVASSPLVIDDQGGLKATQVAARIKRQHLRSPLTLAVVDHLHAMKRPGRNTVDELGADTQLFKDLAKELGIPIVLLCQLSRAGAKQGDHRPTMTDLRGSGSIEEIADVVFLVHREDYYDKNTHLKGVVELIVGKGRDIGMETLYMRNRYDEMRLEQWDGPLPEKSEAAAEKKAAKGFKKTPAAEHRAAKDGGE